MAATENRELFSRCNISEDVIRRITQRITQKTSTPPDVSVASTHTTSNSKSILSRYNVNNKNNKGSKQYHSVSHSNNKNKSCLERLLLSVPLDDDVARFSDNEASTSARGLPLYSENYDSESFCLPSSGYKSDSEGRGRSKYRIRTCNSANPSPSHSPERPATRASVRRTKSLRVPGETERLSDKIRQRLRKESLEDDKQTNDRSIDKLKQFGFKGFNTTSKAKTDSTQESKRKDDQQQNSRLKSRSSNAIPNTEKNSVKDTTATTKGIVNRDLSRTAGNSVLRSRSFNSIDRSDVRNRLRKSETQQNSQSTPATSSTNPTLKQSPNSAFEQVRHHFGAEQWRKRTTSNSSAPETNTIRSSSFSSLHDVWESRKIYEKKNEKHKYSRNNSYTSSNSPLTQQESQKQTLGEKNCFSDVESSDLISRRRERRRLKREIYSQRLTSDRSDSETETEDNYFVRQALERSQRRTRTQSTARRKQRQSNEDSNDENNNGTASDKTLDSGVFELAVSSFSENISKLSKKYNSDEFLNAELADCLSPKSGYSSASESLAESLAESTTTFCESGEETATGVPTFSEMDRKKRGSRFKFKPDKANVKTAVLNSTRAKNVNNASSTSNSSTLSSVTQQSTASDNKQSISSNNAKKNPIISLPKQQQSMTTPAVPAKEAVQIPSTKNPNKSLQTTTTKKSTEPANDQTTPISQKKTSKSLCKETLTSKNSNSSTETNTNANKTCTNLPTKATKDKQCSSVENNEENSSNVSLNDTKQQLKEKRKTQNIDVNKTNPDSPVKASSKAQEKSFNNTTTTTKSSNNKITKKGSFRQSPKEKVDTTTRKNGIVAHNSVDESTKKSEEVTASKPGETVNSTIKEEEEEKSTTKNGHNKERKPISHHNCFTPIDQTKDSHKAHHLSSPAPSKPTRRISHHGCLSSDSDASRSNTPTKTRRVSHAGCFSPVDKSSDSDNSRSSTPTKPRRTSHHNCCKPVGSDSDNSRSNTPTRAPKERRISHHNCLSSPNHSEKQHEQLKLHSPQQKKINKNNKEGNEADQIMSNTTSATTTNGKLQTAIHNGANNHNNNSRKGVIVGPAQRKDEIKPKLARTCVSPTLNKSLEIEINTGTKQLNSIDERSIYIVQSDDEKTNPHILITSVQQTTDDPQHSHDTTFGNHGSSQKHEAPQDHLQLHEKHRTISTTKNDTINEKQTTNMATESSQKQGKQNLNFSIDHRRSSISERSDKHKLKKRGDSVELVLDLESNNTTIKNDDLRSGYTSSGKPKVPLPTTVTSRKNNNEKAVQCLLLSGDSKLSGKTVNVSDTTKQIVINEEILKELGTDILHDIQFTYPQYLITPEQREQLEETIRSQEEHEQESDQDDDIVSEEELDETDSAAVASEKPTNKKNSNRRFEKERAKSKKLQMENTRLQQLLYEVEKARAGTMTALLHVNTMLNKVQSDNTQLEGDLEVCGQEKKMLEHDLKEYSEKELASIENVGAGSKKGQSLSIVVDQWKREKKELLSQLNKFKGKSEEGEKASSRLRIQYKKVKEQLEHSNNAFTMTLKNNLDATKRMEEELKSSLDEKQELYKKLNEGNKFKREMEALKNEMEELKAANEEVGSLKI